jgi:hypothetical protein
MRVFCCSLLLALVGGRHLPAQVEPLSLRVEGTVGACERLLAAAMPPPASPPVDAEQRAFALLHCLRCGRADAARDLLVVAPPPTDPTAVCWALVAHLWYLRATGDVAGVRPHLQPLRAASTADAAWPAVTTFADGALRAHAGFCLGALLEACGDAAGGADATRRAVAGWLELERQCWQPGRGHFRSQPTAGRIVVPEPVQASVLAPAAAGMLIASGDHMLRHLRTAVDALVGGQGADPHAATWILAGAAQLGDADLVDRAWQQLRTAEPLATTAIEAGRLLDAMLFAITGLRIATGAGVDPGLTRLRPHLPPGHQRLAVHNLLADGAWFDLDCELRTGPRQADERDDVEPRATTAPRLFSRLRLVRAVDTRPRTVLLQGAGVQHLTQLRIGDRFERSLPIELP